jgi:hypothetical protein
MLPQVIPGNSSPNVRDVAFERRILCLEKLDIIFSEGGATYPVTTCSKVPPDLVSLRAGGLAWSPDLKGLCVTTKTGQNLQAFSSHATSNSDVIFGAGVVLVITSKENSQVTQKSRDLTPIGGGRTMFPTHGPSGESMYASGCTALLRQTL